MKRLLYFAIIIALIPFVFVYCGGDDDGNISIKGKVTDETGNPIPGANIAIHPEDHLSPASQTESFTLVILLMVIIN